MPKQEPLNEVENYFNPPQKRKRKKKKRRHYLEQHDGDSPWFVKHAS